MVTMNDIAARVGVSQATVSYVLNERSTGVRIREETRLRILEAAAELGYRRNDLARAMVTGKNFVLGFLTRNPSSEGTNRVIVGAQEQANRSKYLIKLLPISDTDARENYRACIERCIEQRLAGILVQHLGQEALDYLHSEVRRYGIPVALVDDPPALKWGIRVVSDDESGIQAAVEHLVDLGHQNIAFISAQARSPLAVARQRCFCEALTRHGLRVPPEYVVSTDWQNQSVIESEVRGFLTDASLRPSAVVCAGDGIAMVTLRVARAAGLVLPRDLSVVGFADLAMAAFADPPLTTVAQSFEEMGRVAVRRLLARAESEGSPNEPETITVPTLLVVRGSTTRYCPS